MSHKFVPFVEQLVLTVQRFWAIFVKAFRPTDFKFEDNTSMTQPTHSETIVLGGGCFWCTEAVFVLVKGVLDVESGYCNGQTLKPSYEQVCSGLTGHNEVIRVTYDPLVISTRVLLEIFFVIHDPTTLNRQGNDRGTQYRSGIYFTNYEQAEAAKTFIGEIDAEGVFDRPLVTEVLPLQNYSEAEDYHQDFFERNPTQGYCMAVAAPKVWKFKKTFSEWVKAK
jgi:peptide-methionine (S)-S-oxide reductase